MYIYKLTNLSENSAGCKVHILKEKKGNELGY